MIQVFFANKPSGVSFPYTSESHKGESNESLELFTGNEHKGGDVAPPLPMNSQVYDLELA
jgi:hypothetical protein